MNQQAKDLKPEMCPGLGSAVEAGNTEGLELANLLVGDGLDANATDIHLDPQGGSCLVRFRVDGRLYAIARLPQATGEQLVRSMEVEASINPASNPDRLEGSARFGPAGTPVRVTRAMTVQGPKLSLRLLEASRINHDIRELGMEEQDQTRLMEWCTHAEGMVLSVGPTGCGKTTTCYSLLNEIKSQRNILTIEDPVEFTIDGLNQISLDQDQPGQPATYAEGVRDMLRHDPDTVFLGEIRDEATANAAVNASFSGHVLLSTMHSRDPVGAVTLLRSMGAKDYEIAASIRIIIGQRILRRLCRHCKQSRDAERHEDEVADELGVTLNQVSTASGCDHCGGTGHCGLTAVFELWRLEQEDHDAILAHEDENKLRVRLRERGVRSLLAAALEKAAAGKVSIVEAMALR